MLLFLDDIRTKEQVYPVYYGDYFEVRSFEEFCAWIEENGLPEIISFDHDLSIEHYAGDFSKEKTGMDCAKWLVEYCLDHNEKLPQYFVHSQNPVGKQNILGLLKGFEREQNTAN